MKRFTPWAAFAVVVAIAVVAVLALDYSSVSHAQGFGAMIADAAAGAAAAEELAREFKAHHAEVKTALEKAGASTQEISARMTELEQKVSGLRTGGASASERIRSWGEQVTHNEGMKALSSNFRGKARFDVKAVITSATADADGSAGALVVPDQQQSVIELPRRKLRIRQLFPPAGRTTSNVIQWPKQTRRTNNAATVAENTTKPGSEMGFQMENWNVTTIAHWVYASRQILDDAPVLQTVIDTELRYGLDYVEDGQLLNGGGTGADLTGVYTGASAFSPVFQASGNATELDVLLQAIAQVDATDFDADGIVVNPLDWRRMQSLKDNIDRYLGPGPYSDQVQRLWQLPLVPSRAMTPRKFLVGSFVFGAQIFDREDANVEISTEDGDNFRNNRVTVLGEKRLAFVVKRPDVFVKGDFDTALAS